MYSANPYGGAPASTYEAAGAPADWNSARGGGRVGPPSNAMTYMTPQTHAKGLQCAVSGLLARG